MASTLRVLKKRSMTFVELDITELLVKFGVDASEYACFDGTFQQVVEVQFQLVDSLNSPYNSS